MQNLGALVRDRKNELGTKENYRDKRNGKLDFERIRDEDESDSEARKTPADRTRPAPPSPSIGGSDGWRSVGVLNNLNLMVGGDGDGGPGDEGDDNVSIDGGNQTRRHNRHDDDIDRELKFANPTNTTMNTLIGKNLTSNTHTRTYICTCICICICICICMYIYIYIFIFIFVTQYAREGVDGNYGRVWGAVVKYLG